MTHVQIGNIAPCPISRPYSSFPSHSLSVFFHPLPNTLASSPAISMAYATRLCHCSCRSQSILKKSYPLLNPLPFHAPGLSPHPLLFVSVQSSITDLRPKQKKRCMNLFFVLLRFVYLCQHKKNKLVMAHNARFRISKRRICRNEGPQKVRRLWRVGWQRSRWVW